MDFIGRWPLLFVIPGLVPGTNRGTGGGVGPRHKAGDDERMCPDLGSIVHPIALGAGPAPSRPTGCPKGGTTKILMRTIGMALATPLTTGP